MSLIQLEHVKKIYNVGEAAVQALKGISINIDKKSFVSFIGPSGSGKSTLLNLVGCLDKPTEGKVFMNNLILRVDGAFSREGFFTQMFVDHAF